MSDQPQPPPPPPDDEPPPDESGADWAVEPWGDVPDLPALPWMRELE